MTWHSLKEETPCRKGQYLCYNNKTHLYFISYWSEVENEFTPSVSHSRIDYWTEIVPPSAL